MSEKVYIIGAGPLGMSLATYCILKKKKIILLEAGKEIGGLAAPFKLKNHWIDKYYHFYYIGDHKYSQKYFSLLKVKFEVFWKFINTATFANKKFYNFDKIFSIIRISKFEIFKVIKTLIKLKLFHPEKNLDKANAYEWCKNNFGHNLTNSVWKPLLKSKFGSNWKKISALWLCTRIKIHLGTKNIKSGKSKFAYLKSTYKTVIEKLAINIKKSGGKTFLNETVLSFEIKNNSVTQIVTNKRKINIKSEEKIISTIPLAALKNIRPLEQKLEYLKFFECVGAVVLILKLSSKLSNEYWTTVADDNIDFDVIIQQNRLYKNTDSEIVYVSKYFTSNSKFFKLKNNEIYDIFIKGLKKMYPDFNEKQIIIKKIFKSNYAAPIPKTKYLNYLPNYKTKIKNFFHVGFEHTYPQDRGVSNSLNLGKKIFQYIYK